MRGHVWTYFLVAILWRLDRIDCNEFHLDHPKQKLLHHPFGLVADYSRADNQSSLAILPQDIISLKHA